MTAKEPPREPLPCDICGAPNAPFGFQYPGGRQAQRPGKRSLWSCRDCRDQAQARHRKATQPAGLSDRAPDLPVRRDPQPSLFDS